MPGAVARILAIQEAKIGKITIPDQAGQKVSGTPIQPTSWAWWYTSVIPAMQEA
jgi:hypothetical protein